MDRETREAIKRLDSEADEPELQSDGEINITAVKAGSINQTLAFIALLLLILTVAAVVFLDNGVVEEPEAGQEVAEYDRIDEYKIDTFLYNAGYSEGRFTVSAVKNGESKSYVVDTATGELGAEISAQAAAGEAPEIEGYSLLFMRQHTKTEYYYTKDDDNNNGSYSTIYHLKNGMPEQVFNGADFSEGFYEGETGVAASKTGNVIIFNQGAVSVISLGDGESSVTVFGISGGRLIFSVGKPDNHRLCTYRIKDGSIKELAGTTMRISSAATDGNKIIFTLERIEKQGEKYVAVKNELRIADFPEE